MILGDYFADDFTMLPISLQNGLHLMKTEDDEGAADTETDRNTIVTENGNDMLHEVKVTIENPNLERQQNTDDITL